MLGCLTIGSVPSTVAGGRDNGGLTAMATAAATVHRPQTSVNPSASRRQWVSVVRTRPVKYPVEARVSPSDTTKKT